MKYYDPPPYYKGELTYVQVPRLIFNPPFEGLSDDARVFYGILLDRMEESYDNPERWSDNGEAYVYYKRTELMRFFNIAQQKATKIFQTLEAADLIQRKRQSADNKPTKIYINEYWEDPPPEQWENPYEASKCRTPFKGPKRRIHSYINVYWILFYAPYKTLSNSARILYGLLVKQMNQDEKKDRLRKDREGAYIYYTREDIMQVLRISDKKATKTLCELENAGLISRQRQGFGRPAKIRIIWPQKYVSPTPRDEMYVSPRDEMYVSPRDEMYVSPRDEMYVSPRDEMYVSTSNNLLSLNYSINQSTNNEAASKAYTAPVDDTQPTRITKEEIAAQINKERLYEVCPAHKDYTDSIIELVYDEVTSVYPCARIGQTTRSRAEVRARLTSLTSEAVEGVIDRMSRLPEWPRNPRAYLLASLYNAATTPTADRRPTAKEAYEKEVAKYVQQLAAKINAQEQEE